MTVRFADFAFFQVSRHNSYRFKLGYSENFPGLGVGVMLG